jgi:hypothetical protein
MNLKATISIRKDKPKPRYYREAISASFKYIYLNATVWTPSSLLLASRAFVPLPLSLFLRFSEFVDNVQKALKEVRALKADLTSFIVEAKLFMFKSGGQFWPSSYMGPILGPLG